ncbi:MAG: pilin [Candidatus Doudnabacteria bacterium]|nr:pilin [Candidatus Doudnabacteria bacterium]
MLLPFVKSKTFKTILIFTLLLLPALAAARGLVPCGNEGESPCTIEDIFALIARVTNWLLMVAGIYAVCQIIGAGFWLVITMGNEEKIAQQKKALNNAVVCFVFAMMAFLIVNTGVNLLFRSKCKINLSNPLKYLTDGPTCDNNPLNK